MSTEAASYTELMAAIQSHVAQIGLRLVDFDDLAGFPAGLSGKVFGPSQVKRLGPEKLFDALRAAGLKLRVEIDPDQRAKMQQRISENYNPRQANQARPNNNASTISTALRDRVFQHVLREARKKRWANTTPEQRSEHARMIANMRWKKRRKEMAKRAKQRKDAHKARKSA